MSPAVDVPDGPLQGRADARLGEIVDRLTEFLTADPELSFQVAARHNGRPVLDVWGGPHLGQDSVTVPYSVTKNTIGVTVGLLVQRGELDLDRTVAEYWPEFAAKGKASVTVRQLLSHQAGLPQTTPPTPFATLLDLPTAAVRLAQSAPLWQPGSAFGYHATTIGNLAAELILRATGRTMHDVYERDIRSPHDIDFFLGLPADQEHRRVDLQPMIRPANDTTTFTPTATGALVLGTRDRDPNDPVSWRLGHPATSGTGSARGIARLLASAVTGVDGDAPILNGDTVEQIGMQQVRGYDEVLGQHDRAHAIVFQKPSAAMPFGGPRAIGHDGAAGAFACVDPETGVAFAYTIVRGPWPGGADPRAVAISRDLPALLTD